MNRYMKVEGTEHTFEVVKLVPIHSEMVSIHFEELPNGKWRILYNAEFLPNFDEIEAFQIKRTVETRSIVLKGIDVELKLSIVTAVRVRPNLLHLDKLQDGTWRMTYNVNTIPDFTKVTSLTMVHEEDVL